MTYTNKSNIVTPEIQPTVKNLLNTTVTTVKAAVDNNKYV